MYTLQVSVIATSVTQEDLKKTLLNYSEIQKIEIPLRIENNRLCYTRKNGRV